MFGNAFQPEVPIRQKHIEMLICAAIAHLNRAFNGARDRAKRKDVNLMPIASIGDLSLIAAALHELLEAA